ncbi:MAG: hypothetical protein JRE40_00195 [Deltaproteobacteria bacterium]|nr:hypothetical protein [Deltaproteobacteria bacterium]
MVRIMRPPTIVRVDEVGQEKVYLLSEREAQAIHHFFGNTDKESRRNAILTDTPSGLAYTKEDEQVFFNIWDQIDDDFDPYQNRWVEED